MIRERLRAKRLPETSSTLPDRERLSNTAVSRAKAVGMWQFMASTARLYGLTVDPWVTSAATRPGHGSGSELPRGPAGALGSVYWRRGIQPGVGRVERGIGRLPGEPDSVDDHTFFQLSDAATCARDGDYVPS